MSNNRNELKAELSRLLRGPVPGPVRAGSVQAAIAYKDWAHKAAAMIKRPTPVVDNLRSMIAEHHRFSGGA